MFKVLIHTKEKKRLRTLPKVDRDKIYKATDLLKENVFHPFLSIKKLDLPYDAWRVKVGVYRLLFTLDGNNIYIYKISHRKDAYKK